MRHYTSGKCRLLFVGDVMLGRLLNETLTRESPQFPWGDVLPVFQQADRRVCNLECVMSDIGSPWSATPKVFHFRSDKKNLAVLKAAGIDAVSLANNHTLDFGYSALLDMLHGLHAAGIACSGAGSNIVTATSPGLMKVQGLRIGLISFTDNQPEWEATPERAGIFYMPVDVEDQRSAKLFELVRYTRRHTDLLIVAAHWGGNWGYSPPLSHVEFGRALVRAGADVIFGHSAHVFRGIEIHRGRPIIYSAGDFIDDYAVDPLERNDQSFIFVLEMDKGLFHRLRLYPTVIRHFQARLAGIDEAREIAARMVKLCDSFQTPASWNPGERCLDIEIC
ncbi:MAG: CapA family protein [Verrucomicrobia subdivision 3 bacterium]|nr:CapA family protein [Limisphaerales bacterium]